MRIEPVVVRGSGYERGRAHGALLSERIKAHLNAWLQSLVKPPISDAQAYLERMLVETDFLAAIRAHTPELLEEIDGIADGAGLPRRLVFALQLLDEEWAYRATIDRRSPPEKCSSMAVVRSEALTWVAQNMDLGVYTDGHQCLLRVDADDDGGASLILSLAGMIGLLGMNSRGVGICVNSLPQLRSSPTGLPVAFVIRKLLQQATLDRAVALLRSIPHATNQHYLIAEAGTARSFEACPAGVVEYRPTDSKRIFHTNHPLAVQTSAGGSGGSSEDSESRLHSLTARLSHGAVGLRDFKNALSSFDDSAHPVCRVKREGSGQIGFTTGSMIAALRSRPRRQCAWFSAGPPILGGYARYAL